MDRYFRHNSHSRSFERMIDDTRSAYAYYRVSSGIFVFTHLEVPSMFLGQGIGEALTLNVFDWLRFNGARSLLNCNFMNSVLMSNPEFADVARSSPPSVADGYNLERYVVAQLAAYDLALATLREGRMDSQYMDILFPRLASQAAGVETQLFAIGSRDEADAYLSLPILGGRYRECVRALQHLATAGLGNVFSVHDVTKLHASLTLFADTSDEWLFETMLEVWFDGTLDPLTMAMLR